MIPRFLLAFVLHAALAGAGYSQEWFEFSGYAMDFPVYQQLNNDLARLANTNRDQFANVGRVRLRPRAELWTGGFLSIEYEINSVYFETPVNLHTTSEKSRRQLIDLTWNPVSAPNHSLVHFVDRLFIRQSLGILEMTLGRQRVSWGTGRFWNPTDLFNPIGPTVFSKIEKDGIDGLLVKCFLGSLSDLSFVYNPEETLGKGNLGARIRTNVAEFDVSVVGGKFDERMVVGGDFAGNFFDAGIRGEFLISSSNDHPEWNFTKYVFGLDHQFTSDLYGLVEFHFNGAGKSETSRYELNRLLNGEIISLGRSYILFQSMVLVHPLVSLSVISLSNVRDQSGMVGGTVSYAWSNEFTVALGGQLFYGDNLSEFWYHPKTLYLRADIYF